MGGLALAIGILVDEATVAIENIHSHLQHGQPLALAVRDGSGETAIPRLLAMVCILAVFISSFFMQGAPRAMFVPLSLAVGFSMMASYLLSSTLVPVLSIWILRHAHVGDSQDAASPAAGIARQRRRTFPLGWLRMVSFDHFRRGYEWLLAKIVRFRWVLVVLYLAVSLAIIGLVGSRLGTEIFPTIDTGQFRLRMRAPDGTDIDRTEQVALKALKVIQETAGADNVQMTLGYLGTIPSTYPINAVYQWMRGPEDAVMWVALKRESGINIEPFKEELRGKLARRCRTCSSPSSRPTSSTR